MVIKSHSDMDEMKTNTQAPSMPLGRGNIRLHFSCEMILVSVRELQGGL